MSSNSRFLARWTGKYPLHWQNTCGGGGILLTVRASKEKPLNNTAGLEFVLTELRTGLTFANLALSAQRYDTDKVKRNTKNARKAYDTLLMFWQQVSLSDKEVLRLNAELDRLKKALRQLGECI